MNISPLPTPYTLFTPADLDTITFTSIQSPTDLDQEGLFPVTITTGDTTPQVLLSLSLTPTEDHTVTLTSLRPIILDYIDSLTPTATAQPTRHFITLSLATAQQRYDFTILAARQPLTLPTATLFQSFLTPAATLVRPLPPTAQYEPLHILETITQENSPLPTAHVTALWTDGYKARRTEQALTPATLETYENTLTDDDQPAYYRISTLNAAPTLLQPPTDDTTTATPYQLISYDIQCGPRRQSYRIIPPSLTLTSDGPRPILYANAFYLPEVIYFYGSTTHTHKPTYTALRTYRALTINYERTLVPTFTLHTGPLLPATLAQLPDLIISPRPYLLLSPDGSSLAPITLTEASHAPTTIPTDLQTATITYRRPDDTFSLSIATTPRTFDPTFDTTFY